MLVSKKEEREQQFIGGLSRVEVLPGTNPDMKIYRCTLKAGHDWQPDVYRYGDTTQFFAFVTPSGYVLTKDTAYDITGYAAFVPDYDAERFTIHAGSKDLEFWHFVGRMVKWDVERMDYIHFELPRFRLFKDAWRYTEGFTGGMGSTCLSHHVLEHRFLGRYSMGWNVGEGPSMIGSHVHPDLEQWYFILPGGCMTYTAGDESIHVSEDDVTYTSMGTSHGSSVAENEKINYFWVELATDGYKS